MKIIGRKKLRRSRPCGHADQGAELFGLLLFSRCFRKKLHAVVVASAVAYPAPSANGFA